MFVGIIKIIRLAGDLNVMRYEILEKEKKFYETTAAQRFCYNNVCLKRLDATAYYIGTLGPFCVQCSFVIAKLCAHNKPLQPTT